MKRLIEITTLKEGEFLNKWMFNRVIKRNQNVLGVITGPTGSSKSMDCLSAANTWYQYKFNQEFPIENCCFSPTAMIKRIKELQDKKKIRKGEFFILEESGTNLGSLDYQSKMAKMFVYILQSFRSLNLILFMNLPVLTMLNKSARQLLHFNFITHKIDYENKIARVKPFFHQLNQQTCKSYWKFPKIRIKKGSRKKIIKLERLKFSLPPKDLINSYEEYKLKYINNLTDDFIAEIENQEKEEVRKMARKQLNPVELQVFEDMNEGLSVAESSENRGRGERATYQALARIKDKGYSIKKGKYQANA